MRPDAAGVDIGAGEIFLAAPTDRAAENVRSFPTIRQDLYALADRLARRQVKTVAMNRPGYFALSSALIGLQRSDEGRDDMSLAGESGRYEET